MDISPILSFMYNDVVEEKLTESPVFCYYEISNLIGEFSQKVMKQWNKWEIFASCNIGVLNLAFYIYLFQVTVCT